MAPRAVLCGVCYHPIYSGRHSLDTFLFSISPPRTSRVLTQKAARHGLLLITYHMFGTTIMLYDEINHCIFQVPFLLRIMADPVVSLGVGRY